jgi:CHASE1-domain containing sensor protein
MSRKNGRMTFEVADLRPVAAVLAVGLVLSVTAFYMVRGYFVGVDSQQFDRDTAYYSENFKGSVARHVNSMAAIHAFVSASHDVNRWEFSSFAHQILPQNSGFKAVLWLPHVAAAQRKGFEDGMQQDGLFGLHLREPTEAGDLVDASARADYLPVAYVEPFESSFSLIGVDLQKSPIYAPLFAEAARTGKVVASAPLDRALVDGARAPIALVVFPLIKAAKSGPAAMKSAAVNPTAPSGYALGVLQLDRVIQSAIGPHAPVEAAIAYGPARTVYAAGARRALPSWYGTSEFHGVVPFTVAGTRFFLAMRSPPGSNILTRFYVPAGAGLLVLALTALLAQSMVATVLRKRQVERAVIERTAELRASRPKLSCAAPGTGPKARAAPNRLSSRP